MVRLPTLFSHQLRWCHLYREDVGQSGTYPIEFFYFNMVQAHATVEDSVVTVCGGGFARLHGLCTDLCRMHAAVELEVSRRGRLPHSTAHSLWRTLCSKCEVHRLGQGLRRTVPDCTWLA